MKLRELLRSLLALTVKAKDVHAEFFMQFFGFRKRSLHLIRSRVSTHQHLCLGLLFFFYRESYNNTGWPPPFDDRFVTTSGRPLPKAAGDALREIAKIGTRYGTAGTGALPGLAAGTRRGYGLHLKRRSF